jgi:chromosome partitioning protein
MRKIAVLNQKGGVGKTTSVVNIAASLADDGHKVVVIDLDPQAHLTIHLGLEPESVSSGSYTILTQSQSFEQSIEKVRPNLWLLAANIDLVGAESELVSVVGRETILREAIREIEEEFDYLIIDCPPSLGLLTLNALAAVEEILIPLQPHFLALQGFGKLLQTVELVNKRINPVLKVKGVLLCMFDSRASLPTEVKADIEQFLDNARGSNCAWSEARVLPVCIRRNIKLAEAPSYGKTIFEYEQNCHGAEDYAKVAEFLHTQKLPPELSETPPVGTAADAVQPPLEIRSITPTKPPPASAERTPAPSINHQAEPDRDTERVHLSDESAGS